MTTGKDNGGLLPDALMIAVAVGFFGLTWLLVEICDRLGKEK